MSQAARELIFFVTWAIVLGGISFGAALLTVDMAGQGGPYLWVAGVSFASGMGACVLIGTAIFALADWLGL